jgi:hypothetical protein
MGILGTLLKNRRAGETHLAWNLPALSGPPTLALASEAFRDGEAIPVEHAGKRAGGRNTSPPLAWSAAPSGTASLLLVVEDVDAPTSKPFVHCVAVIDPSVHQLPTSGLSRQGPADGVRLLRSGMGSGYLGPAPLRLPAVRAGRCRGAGGGPGRAIPASPAARLGTGTGACPRSPHWCLRTLRHPWARQFPAHGALYPAKSHRSLVIVAPEPGRVRN